MYPPELRSTNLDVDWIYRRAIPNVLQNVFAVIWKADGALRNAVRGRLNQCQSFIASKHKGLGGLLSGSYPSGNMVLWVAVLLASYLFIGFVSKLTA